MSPTANDNIIANNRGLPPIRIWIGRIRLPSIGSPVTDSQKIRQSLTLSGSSLCTLNNSYNGLPILSISSKRVVAVPKSMILGSFWSVCRRAQLSIVLTCSPSSIFRFSTISKIRLPSSSAKSSRCVNA